VIARAASLALLLVLSSCPQAHALARLVPLTAAVDAPLSDGGRWAVIPVTGGMLVVDGDDPASAPQFVAVGQRCASQRAVLRGIGGGLVVADCQLARGELHVHLVVYDLASGTSADAAGTTVLDNTSDGYFVEGIGRSWMAYSIARHSSTSLHHLLDWRSGRSIPAPTLGRDRVADLDLAAGSRRVCRTIRRPALRRQAFVYRSPFALVQHGTTFDSRLDLERCGGASVTLVRTHEVGSIAAALGRRAAAFAGGRQIEARSLATGARKRWRAPLGKAPYALAAAGRSLLVTVQGGPGGGPLGLGFTVYRGRLP
jgi:hypothetical protein